MGTCLVTKLKQSVDNSSLKILGTIEISEVVEWVSIYGKSITIDFIGNGVLKYKSSGNVIQTPMTTTSSGSGSDYTYTLEQGAKLIIKNKYNITSLRRVPVDLKDLEYSTLITSLRLDSTEGATGNIKYLSMLTALTELSFRGTACEGKIEDMVAGQISNGRTSCSGIAWTSTLNDNISLGGSTATIKNSGGSFTWSSAGSNTYTITFTPSSGTAVSVSIIVNSDGSWSYA